MTSMIISDERGVGLHCVSIACRVLLIGSGYVSYKLCEHSQHKQAHCQCVPDMGGKRAAIAEGDLGMNRCFVRVGVESWDCAALCWACWWSVYYVMTFVVCKGRC